MRFMPNDIVIVRSEITIYETVKGKYANKNYIEDNSSVMFCFRLLCKTLTFMNSLKVCSMCASREIHSTPYFNQNVWIYMQEKDLFGDFFGLNKLWFIRSVTLTVRCEVTIYETVEEKYARANYYKKNDNNKICCKASLWNTICPIF